MADSSVIQIPLSTTKTTTTELKELTQSPPTITTTKSPSSNSSTIVIDKTLSSAANLAKLLPSGTVLALQTLSPSFANKGNCYTSNRYLTSTLILFCTISCIFFSFTDSLIGSDGKLYYGLATFKGFYVFNYVGEEEDYDKVFKGLKKLRITTLDYVHAFFSSLVFFSITFSDASIQSCFFPNAGKDTKEFLVNLPLGAGFLSALVFMIFPTSRKGVGYSDATPTQQY
ncbi:protein DMP2-like [Dioscorea cayenensis subsp. rotundata]|uniref:Protein DMP2-like n=1 Tax=Dioscorea cayennensis subsp. rotundata TaxID=55577 RepID=A0AB40AHD3_DIOCR|nr:protein DMP2-like [Dioscorea cayenensis subsp. rotundata]